MPGFQQRSAARQQCYLKSCIKEDLRSSPRRRPPLGSAALCAALRASTSSVPRSNLPLPKLQFDLPPSEEYIKLQKRTYAAALKASHAVRAIVTQRDEGVCQRPLVVTPCTYPHSIVTHTSLHIIPYASPTSLHLTLLVIATNIQYITS